MLWLTINRPERRNAISPGVLAGLIEALTRANADREGARHRAHRRRRQGLLRRRRPGHRPVASVRLFRAHAGLRQPVSPSRQLNVPLVARVSGACMASGMGLMAMCDMAVAAPHAIFGLPEVKGGCVPGPGAVGAEWSDRRAALTELCVTGEPISAKEALAAGPDQPRGRRPGRRRAGAAGSLSGQIPAAIRRGLYLMKRIGAMSFESMAFTESQIACSRSDRGTGLANRSGRTGGLPRGTTPNRQTVRLGAANERRKAGQSTKFASAAPRASGATPAWARRSWWPAVRWTTWCSTTWPS